MPRDYWYHCDSCDYRAVRYRNVRRCKCGGNLIREQPPPNGWIDVNQKCPKLRDHTSAVVLIAKPLKSRPGQLVVSVGYLQKFGIEECVWVDALSRVPDLPSVRYWMPLPDPPVAQRTAVGVVGRSVEVRFEVAE
jgi:hypothetical protein